MSCEENVAHPRADTNVQLQKLPIASHGQLERVEVDRRNAAAIITGERESLRDKLKLQLWKVKFKLNNH